MRTRMEEAIKRRATKIALTKATIIFIFLTALCVCVVLFGIQGMSKSESKLIILLGSIAILGELFVSVGMFFEEKQKMIAKALISQKLFRNKLIQVQPIKEKPSFSTYALLCKNDISIYTKLNKFNDYKFWKEIEFEVFLNKYEITYCGAKVPIEGVNLD